MMAENRYENGREQRFDELVNRIKQDPCDYRNYITLGEWYEDVNIDQAYLTYEHARYLCKRNFEAEGIEQEQFDSSLAMLNRKLDQLEHNSELHVNPASFIILSYNTLDLTQKCLESIRRTCDNDAYEIVVVDNNSSDGSKEWLRQQKDIVFVDNDYNAGFPGGCNLGFRAASTQNDMLLLNSDTEMMENGFYTLRMGLYSDRRNGMSGGFSNANYLNEFADHVPPMPDEAGYYDYGKKVNVPSNIAVIRKTVLYFFFVLIRRDVFDLVGELDELFNPGNHEDLDYSYRILLAGYRNVLCWNSFIIHRSHSTFSRNKMDHRALIDANYVKFYRKWHFALGECCSPHEDLIALIQHKRDEEFSVLFIGCGAGEALVRIEEMFPRSKVFGIEKRPVVAKMASSIVNAEKCDIESEDIPFEKKEYDYVMIANTLERCTDPEYVLLRAGRYLSPGGRIICGISNFQNAKVIGDMLRGHYCGSDSGARDPQNVNFFTYNDMTTLFKRTGYGIEFIFAITLIEISANADKDFFDRICEIDGTSDWKRFNDSHYVFRLIRKDNNSLNEFVDNKKDTQVYYNAVRDDITSQIHEDVNSSFRLLDVGCGTGEMLASLQRRFPNSKFYGIEKNEKMAAMAASKANIFHGDIENDYLPYEEDFFDYIVLGDVIPEFYDADAVLTKLRPYLKKDGYILSSINNVLNAKTVYDLLQGKFFYAEQDTRRFTQRRFYTLGDIMNLFSRNGYVIEFNIRVQTPHAMTSIAPEFFDRLSHIPGVVERQQFDDYNYIMRIKKSE